MLHGQKNIKLSSLSCIHCFNLGSPLQMLRFASNCLTLLCCRTLSNQKEARTFPLNSNLSVCVYDSLNFIIALLDLKVLHSRRWRTDALFPFNIPNYETKRQSIASAIN